MATGKQGFVRAAEHQHSVSAQREGEMHIQAPLTAVYVHAVPGLSQAQTADSSDRAVIPLALPMVCAKQSLPVLTLHLASGTSLQQQRPASTTSAPKPKSAGKHVCPHCGRDCMKPSVLEKHLRCHTGERPYPCTTCGISFKTQSNLYKHKRTQAHARLSSESEKGVFSSQESIQSSSSRDTCSSSPSLESQSEDSVRMKRSDSILPSAATTTCNSVLACSVVGKTESDTERALRNAAVVGLVAAPGQQQEILSAVGQRMEPSSQGKIDSPNKQMKSPDGDGHTPLTPNRIRLQRQEATLFSKMWESSLSRGKSQSHDSTDSGFSDSSEQHCIPSPKSILHDPSMESLTESSMELQGQPGVAQAGPASSDRGNKVSVQEKRKLEEHISKLISDNDALVDDKHLENVRPRKTVLSKQGSIDLPMPYTYKDSFHFEMKSSKHMSNWQQPDRRGKQALYSSVPTQCSDSVEHAPLTRSSSLPFNVYSPHCERTDNESPQERNGTLGRRCSGGPGYPLKFTTNSVDQQVPSHRSLVRQVAVDCLPAAEGSPVERSSVSSLSSDGDCNEILEPGGKRYRRKKSQKFAYNKWYMYGGKTFTKLYGTEKDNMLKTRKSTHSLEQEESLDNQISQQRDPVSLAVSSDDFISSSNTMQSAVHSSSPAVCLPPTVSMPSVQKSSPVFSLYTGPFLKNTLEPLQQSFTRQNNPLNFDTNSPSVCTKGTHEKRAELVSEVFVSHLPSGSKKQRTEEHIFSLTQSTTTEKKGLSLVSGRVSQADVNTYNIINQAPQSVMSDGTQKSTNMAQQGDLRLNIYHSGGFMHHSSSQPHSLLKRHSSPLCAVSVSRPSGSHSASTCIPSTTKNSFLPKYQLKIPGPLDGGADSCVTPAKVMNKTLSTQAVEIASLYQPATTSPHSDHCLLAAPSTASVPGLSGIVLTTTATQLKTEIPPSGQKYPTFFTEASTRYDCARSTAATITSGMPFNASEQNKQVAIIANIKQNQTCPDTVAPVQNQSTETTSSTLNQPVTTITASESHRSATPITASIQNELLMQKITPSSNQSVTSAQLIHGHSAVAVTSSMQNTPAPSITVSRQPSVLQQDAPLSECLNPLDGITAEVSPATFQSAQFDGKVMLLNSSSQLMANDTFYVRTADLHIVLKLISDEQLAQIEPQIEKPDHKLIPGCSVLDGYPPGPETGTNSRGTSKELQKQDSNDTNICLAQSQPNLATTECINSENRGENKQKYSGLPKTKFRDLGLKRATSCSSLPTVCQVSTPLDQKKYTSAHQSLENCQVEKERESLTYQITSGSQPSQRPCLESGEPLFHSPQTITNYGTSTRAEDLVQLQTPTVPSQTMTNTLITTPCKTGQSSVSSVPSLQQKIKCGEQNVRSRIITGIETNNFISTDSSHYGETETSVPSQKCQWNKNLLTAPGSTGSATAGPMSNCEEIPLGSEHHPPFTCNKSMDYLKDRLNSKPPSDLHVTLPSEFSKECILQTVTSPSSSISHGTINTSLTSHNQTTALEQKTCQPLAEEVNLLSKTSLLSPGSAFLQPNHLPMFSINSGLTQWRAIQVVATDSARAREAEMMQTERERQLTSAQNPETVPLQVSPNVQNVQTGMQPGQPNLCQAACISSNSQSHRSGSELLRSSDQQKTVSQKCARGANEPESTDEVSGHTACTLDKPSTTHHSSQQACLAQKLHVKGEGTSMSGWNQEKRPMCGDSPVNTLEVNQVTGPREGGSLQSSELQKPGTKSQGRIPQEPESRRTGEREAQTNSTCHDRENNSGNKTEGESTSDESCLTAAQPYLHPSPQVTTSFRNTEQTTDCGANNILHTTQLLGHKECDSFHGSGQIHKSEISMISNVQSATNSKRKERILLGGHQKLTSSSAESTDVNLPHSTCGHQPANPGFLEASNDEVQKKTQAVVDNGMNSITPPAYTKGPLLGTDYQHKRMGTVSQITALDRCTLTQTEMVNNYCTSSSSAEVHSCLSTHTHPVHTSSVYSLATQTNQTNVKYTTTPHPNPTETNATLHFLNSNLKSGLNSQEEEENASSSDDEGKLVIELE